MEKVPLDYLQKTREGTTLKSKSVQKGSQTESSSIMGATSAESSSTLSPYLSSSNATNSALTHLSTAVVSCQKNDITNRRIKTESTINHEKSIPIYQSKSNNDGRGKKRRLENISKMGPTRPGSNSGTTMKDFAHEFIDSDTSLSSSEEEKEEISPSSTLEAHKKIDKDSSLVLTPGVPLIHKPYAMIDKPVDMSNAGTQSLETKTEAVLEHGIKASISDVQYSIKQYADIPTSNGVPSGYTNPDRRTVSGSLNTIPSTSRKIGDFTGVIPKRSTLKRLRAGKNPSSDQSTGRWTKQEHEAFLAGLKEYGREWKKVAYKIPTRTSAQIRSHAQKYFAKIARDEQQHAAALAASAQVTNINPIPEDNSIDHLTGSSSSDYLMQNVTPAMVERFHKILKDPESAQREVEETLGRLHDRYRELQQTIERKQQQRILKSGNRNSSNNAINRSQTHLIGSLHVLGDACAKQENISEHEASTGRNGADSTITRQTTVVENENLVEINNDHLQKLSQKNDPFMSSHEGSTNSTFEHNKYQCDKDK